MSDATEKEHAVLSVFSEWTDCMKCDLGELREKKKEESEGRAGRIVYGDGNVNADLVVIGIGPGEVEDTIGAPFMGESGNILNEYLSQVHIDRRDLFIMNTVACRPYSRAVDFKTKRMKEENRDPTPLEREHCRPMWEEVLYLIDPLLIVAMGKPAVQEVTGRRSVTMREAQGKIDRCVIKRRAVEVTYPVMCMYHPAFLSRSGDTYQGGPWHQELIAWRRTAYFLDQLKSLHHGVPMPDRGFTEEEMFLIKGGIIG